MESKNKRTISILLAVYLFIALFSSTAAAVIEPPVMETTEGLGGYYIYSMCWDWGYADGQTYAKIGYAAPGPSPTLVPCRAAYAKGFQKGYDSVPDWQRKHDMPLSLNIGIFAEKLT